MQEQINTVCQMLKQGQPCVMALVLHQAGSAPRAAGARMLIKPDGKILGTIGGGIMEANVIEAAREVFDSQKSITKTFDMTSTIVDSADMICGGRMEILIEYCTPEKELLRLFNDLRHELDRYRKCLLVTELMPLSGNTWQVRRALIRKNESIYGDAVIPVHLNAEIKANMANMRNPVLREIDGQRFFVEPYANMGTVYLFGAGHVALEVANLAKNVDFQTVVMDDRREFANSDRFVTADEVIVRPSFEHALEGLEIDEDSYMVILTRGHSYDNTVLRQVLRTSAGYIGMIGSTRKRDTIYKALQNEGVSARELERVHCPIGLAIKAQTPEEIAVSVVAELIQSRASQ
ncbi:XdhC family protein [Desulfococcaceae bacterium HSG9]|nr:XdhC family protein [Desulfococcaceae bacterium HSG9]